MLIGDIQGLRVNISPSFTLHCMPRQTFRCPEDLHLAHIARLEIWQIPVFQASGIPAVGLLTCTADRANKQEIWANVAYAAQQLLETRQLTHSSPEPISSCS